MAAMLFGRSAERAHLETLLDEVVSGPVGCVLEGVPGIGKTTLWRESVESGRRRGYQVLETAPSEPDSALAFSGLGDLFERLPDNGLKALSEAQAHALNAACFGRTAGGFARSASAAARNPRRVARAVRRRTG